MHLFERQSIDAHLLDHGQETVGASRREVLLEPNLLDEIEFAVENLVGSVVAEDLDDEADETLDDDSITVAGEVDEVSLLVKVGLNPDAALAALDEVLRGLVLLSERFKVVA